MPFSKEQIFWLDFPLTHLPGCALVAGSQKSVGKNQTVAYKTKNVAAKTYGGPCSGVYHFLGECKWQKLRLEYSDFTDHSFDIVKQI